MSFQRSTLFIALVCMAVLTGYGFDVCGGCCSHEKQAHVEHGGDTADTEASGNEDGCQCICHQIVCAFVAEPLRMGEAVLMTGDVVARAAQFPPEAEPRGIDHPPQLG